MLLLPVLPVGGTGTVVAPPQTAVFTQIAAMFSQAQNEKLLIIKNHKKSKQQLSMDNSECVETILNEQKK